MTTTANLTVSPAFTRVQAAGSAKISAAAPGSAPDATGFSSALEGAMPQSAHQDHGNSTVQDTAGDGKDLPQDTPQADNRVGDPASDTGDAAASSAGDQTGVDGKTAADAAVDSRQSPAKGAPPGTLIPRQTAADETQPTAAPDAAAGPAVTTGMTQPLPDAAAGPPPANAVSQPVGAQVQPLPAAAAPPVASEDAAKLPRIVDSMDLLTPAMSKAEGDNPDVTLLMLLWRRVAPDQTGPRGHGAPADATLSPVSSVSGSGAAAPSTATATGLPTLAVDTPLSQADWAQGLGERIQWLVGQRLQGAEIRLNPAHLGPMEVKVQMHNDQASIQFLSSHQAVRDALEAALPRLRDMLGSQGVDLLSVDISDRSMAGDQQGYDGSATASQAVYGQTGGEEGGDAEQRQWTTPLIPSSGVDLFV